MITVTVQKRSAVGKGLTTLRNEHIVPAVVYGFGINQAITLSVKNSDFERLLRSEDAARVFNLEIEEGETFPVLLKEVQRAPLSGLPVHIDFHKVRTDQKITAEVAIHFVGEASAVKNLAGVLVKNIDHLKVSCLPLDLVSELKVDLSSLVELDKPIRVKDLQVPASFTVLDDQEEVVATVVAQEAEEAPLLSEEDQIAKIAAVAKDKVSGEGEEKSEGEKEK